MLNLVVWPKKEKKNQLILINECLLYTQYLTDLSPNVTTELQTQFNLGYKMLLEIYLEN